MTLLCGVILAAIVTLRGNLGSQYGFDFRGIWRAAGTGAALMVGLAVLVAGCTVASNCLTNFRAYATVLAGYTAGIIASGAINAPDQVFFIAMARTACILLGIASSI